MKALLQAGPFQTLNATNDPFYLKPGEGAVVENFDVSAQPDALVTSLGRTVLLPNAVIANNTVLIGIAGFYSYKSESYPQSRIKSLENVVFSAYDPGTNLTYSAIYDVNTGIQLALPNMRPWTQAVQFQDTFYTNGGDRIIIDSSGTAQVDYWQIDPSQLPAYPGAVRTGSLAALSYNVHAGHFNTASGSAPSQKYQYAVTFRRSASWTATGSGPHAPSMPGGGGDAGTQGTYQLQPDLPTFQESSPILTALGSTTTNGMNQPCFAVPAAIAQLSDLVTGTDILGDNLTTGETYYGVLYRASSSQPTFVMVDYLINFPQGTDTFGNPCFVDSFGDQAIVNNVIMATHNDVPPILGQTYPGPALTNLNTPNSGPVQSFAQANHNRSFAYLNPAFIAKHKNRMFVFTLYPTAPLFYKIGGDDYENRAQFQPQLWYSNYGVPWSFNDVDQLLLVGPEDTAGNNAITTDLGTDIWDATYFESPWQPNQVCDTPMGLASTGSLLCLFKQQSVWVLFGDSPAEFQQGLRRAFNYGCVSTPSITPAEGGVFWLCGDPISVWFFDGAAPSYVSEPIRRQLESFPLSELQNAAGGYSDRTFYLMFPPSSDETSPAYKNGITYCYYTASQRWYTLPYAGFLMFSPSYNRQSAAMALSEPVTDPTSETALNVSAWLVQDAVRDLGNPVTGTWVSNKTESEMPGMLKKYSAIILTAPQQDATVTVTLTIDDGVNVPNIGDNIYSKTWDLLPLGIGGQPGGLGGQSPYSRVFTLPAWAIGYTAQLEIDVTNRSTTQQAVITSCVVTGENHGPVQSTAAFDGTQGNVSP